MADIRSFFASSTTASTSIISSNEAESEEEIEVSPSKAPHLVSRYYPRNVQNFVLHQVLENT